MGLDRFLDIPSWFRVIDEYEDKKFNEPEDVKSGEYPNYNVLPTYDYRRAEALPGFNLLVGGSYGFLSVAFIGIPVITRKYRNMGYRDWKLMEKMCLPLFCWSFGAMLLGIGIGGLFEIRRVANQDINGNIENRKVL